MYTLIDRLLWRIYSLIYRRRRMPPDLYLDRSGHLCTIDQTGRVITFGVRHD